MFSVIKEVAELAKALIGGALSASSLLSKFKSSRSKITWKDAFATAETLLKAIEVSHWRPEIIVGLGRSGGIWGGWLAGNLGSLPFYVIDKKLEVNTFKEAAFPNGSKILKMLRATYPQARKIIIIEGAISNGHTPAEFFKQFKEDLKGLDVRYATLYKNPTAHMKVDYVGLNGPDKWPEKFPWHLRDAYNKFLKW